MGRRVHRRRRRGGDVDLHLEVARRAGVAGASTARTWKYQMPLARDVERDGRAGGIDAGAGVRSRGLVDGVGVAGEAGTR